MLVSSHNCLISNNTFSSNKQHGIFLTHSSSNNISKNNISDNTYYGITFDTSNNNTIFWNSINSNKNIGIYIHSSSNNNTVLSNNIKENGNIKGLGGSILLDRSSNNKIHRNNFINNVKCAYFFDCTSNNWNGNYWDKPRLFPKIILGRKIGIIWWPWFNFDWHPAKEPYDI
jgi:parallel beta-helix repeat protein